MATTKGPNVYSDVEFESDCYIMFGKESAGIPEEILLQHPESCVRLPMLPYVRSLNLSNTVAIGVYEVLRQWDFPELQNFGELHRYHWNEEE